MLILGQARSHTPLPSRQKHEALQLLRRTYRSPGTTRHYPSDTGPPQTFNGAELIKLISSLVKVDDRWIPREKGYSLYLRPTLIGTQRTLGIGPTASALLYVITSPVGPYYPTGFKAVKLMATTDRVRAWPGGTGAAKLGANYSPCVVPQIDAARQGYHQNLWYSPRGCWLLMCRLFGPEDYLTEVGTMNLFVAWVNEAGEKELITAPLDGTILDGVTRDSILQLARERLAPEGWKTSERKITMPQVRQAAHEGRLVEVFGAGTAAIVSPVRTIHYHGEDIEIPLQPGKEAGALAERMKAWIESIQYGEEQNHPWSVVVE
jgi:branched-chain amino acid aminotransferase